MEIVFCERCDSSIPHGDIERGVAREVAGVLLCAPCRAREARRRLALAVLLPAAVLAAAALGAAVAVLVVGKPIEALQESVSAREAGEVLARGEREDLFRGLSRLAEADRGLASGILEAASRTGEAEASLRGALAACEERVRALEEEVVRLKDALRALAAAPAEPAAAAPAARPEDPEAWLALLGDADAGVRLSALVALEGVGEPRVTERCLELLGDPDGAVRAEAAKILGARREARAVGPLIDLLTEADAAVRSAAHRALSGIAGQSLDFYDPADTEEARVAAAAKIREMLGGR